MRYRRMPIEREEPAELGYEKIRNNLAESAASVARLTDYGVDGEVGNVCWHMETTAVSPDCVP